MSNAFFVPFNHQPTSVTFHTAPVTLGADEYARLVVMPQYARQDQSSPSTLDLTIDGEVVAPQLTWTLSDFDNNEFIIMPCNGILYMLAEGASEMQFEHVYGNTTTSSVLGTATNFNVYASNAAGNASLSGPVSVPVFVGNRIRYNSATNNNRDLALWLDPFEETTKEFWLPPSTVISSTDGSTTRRYMLEKYSAIS